jgi:hypothetical protein
MPTTRRRSWSSVPNPSRDNQPLRVDRPDAAAARFCTRLRCRRLRSPREAGELGRNDQARTRGSERVSGLADLHRDAALHQSERKQGVHGQEFGHREVDDPGCLCEVVLNRGENPCGGGAGCGAGAGGCRSGRGAPSAASSRDRLPAPTRAVTRLARIGSCSLGLLGDRPHCERHDAGRALSHSPTVLTAPTSPRRAGSSECAAKRGTRASTIWRCAVSMISLQKPSGWPPATGRSRPS